MNWPAGADWSFNKRGRRILGISFAFSCIIEFENMFAMFDCTCIEQAYKHLASDTDAKATKDRIELLQRGAKFAKKALLGLTSQEMFMKLSDDTSAIQWRTIGAI